MLNATSLIDIGLMTVGRIADITISYRSGDPDFSSSLGFRDPDPHLCENVSDKLPQVATLMY